MVTWVYENNSFVPIAKIVDNKCYSVLSDYIGRPIQAYDNFGNLVWSTEYDIYGALKNLKGDRNFIPFRQLGQYEDVETGLYYNRFRYYDPNTGTYISKDPIGLAGGLNVYAYVSDINKYVDVFGLEVIAKVNGVKIIAYPGPDVTSNRPEHRPYHIHIEEGNYKTRILLEDFEKQGKRYQPGDVYPGDPSMTNKMKKIMENQDLEDLLDKTKKIYNGCQ